MVIPVEKNLNKLLWKQRDDGEHVDLIISTKDGQVHAHRALLAFRSKTFCDLLKDLVDEEMITVMAKDFYNQEVLDSLKCVYLSTEDYPIENYGFLKCFEQEQILLNTSARYPHLTGMESRTKIDNEADTSLESAACTEKNPAVIENESRVGRKATDNLQITDVVSVIELGKEQDTLSEASAGTESEPVMEEDESLSAMKERQRILENIPPSEASKTAKACPPVIQLATVKKSDPLATQPTTLVNLSAIKGRKRVIKNISPSKPVKKVKRSLPAREMRNSPRTYKPLINPEISDHDYFVTKKMRRQYRLDKSRTCHCCGEVWLTKSKLATHYKKQEEMEKKCTYCKSEYDTKEERETHEKTCMKQRNNNAPKQADVDPRDPQGDEFYCLYCDDVLKSVVLLKNHVKLKHFELIEAKVIRCLICNKHFDSRNSSPHVLVHIDRRYYRFHCEECEIRFAVKSKFEEHRRSVHTRQLALKCKFCDQRFARSPRRADHQKVCSENPHRSAFQCNYCDKKFHTRSSQSYHMRSCKKNPNRVEGKGLMEQQCRFCGRRYDSDLKCRQHEYQCLKKPDKSSEPGMVHPVENAAPTCTKLYELPAEKTKDYKHSVGGSVNDQILQLLGRN